MPVAPLLQTGGIAIADGGQRRLNHIQIVGVDARFGEIGKVDDAFYGLSPDDAIVNRRLASRLQLKPGDELLLRIKKLDFFPEDAPLALDSESSVTQRVTIKAVASDSEFGSYNLRANQIEPYSVFVSLSSLSDAMELENRANILLVSEKSENPLSLQVINSALRSVWTLADAGFEIT